MANYVVVCETVEECVDHSFVAATEVEAIEEMAKLITGGRRGRWTLWGPDEFGNPERVKVSVYETK